MTEAGYNEKTTVRSEKRSLDPVLMNYNKNITAPKFDYFFINVVRTVPQKKIGCMKLNVMPGFKLTWKYDKHTEPYKSFINSKTTEQFRR